MTGDTGSGAYSAYLIRAGSAIGGGEVASCVSSNTRPLQLQDGMNLMAIVQTVSHTCSSSSGATFVVPLSGQVGPPPVYWYKMTPEQLRKAGWRREVETSPSMCKPAP